MIFCLNVIYLNVVFISDDVVAMQPNLIAKWKGVYTGFTLSNRPSAFGRNRVRSVSLKNTRSISFLLIHLTSEGVARFNFLRNSKVLGFWHFYFYPWPISFWANIVACFGHFAPDIFQCIFFNENVWNPHKIFLKFVRKVRINNIPALV